MLETIEQRVSSTQNLSTKLIPAEHAVLAREQRELLYKLEQFQAPYLKERLLGKGVFNSGEEYEITFSEFKKYVALSQFYDGSIGMASPKVDEVWHQFILFTREYQGFCSNLLGQFLHHSPHTSQTPKSKKTEGVTNFREAYNQTFGEIPSIWNAKEGDCEECTEEGCNVDPDPD